MESSEQSTIPEHTSLTATRSTVAEEAPASGTTVKPSIHAKRKRAAAAVRAKSCKQNAKLAEEVGAAE